MTEKRAEEIAIAVVTQRGWTGPFKTYVTKSKERGEEEWGEVFISQLFRAAIVYLDVNGEVMEFRLVRE
jgi:hypothetical protein